ncbi:MAG: hypothetical protein KGN84_04005 [Acidobacteriota bacterium]|nr:hypothetical protein [Acidobacteriota bacterium]
MRRTLDILAQWIDWASLRLLGRPARCAPDSLRPLSKGLRREAPKELRNRRAPVPEAFRCQDLTPGDAVSMAREICSAKRFSGRVRVVGLRTAGIYFAPLVAACLREETPASVRWTSLRPKNVEFTPGLRGAGRGRTEFVIVDDHPNTGATLRMALDLLRKKGVPDRRITIAIPEHPARPGWTLPEAAARGVKIVNLPDGRRWKAAFLESPILPDYVSLYLRQLGWKAVSCPRNSETDLINARFREECASGFQVRLKRLIDVTGIVDGEAAGARFLVKSVGAGWLGYHAFLIGERLRGSVPPVLGLRHGFLFEQWIEGAEPARGPAMIPAVADYVAKRAMTLPLDRDPSRDAQAGTWSAWDELAFALCRIFGRRSGVFYRHRVRTALEAAYPAANYAVIDGRMGAGEWIEAGEKPFKADFEQHSFGGAEIDVADPAYDLAYAAVDLELDRSGQMELTRRYAKAVLDPGIQNRLPIFRLLRLLIGRKAAAFWLREREGGLTQGFADQFLKAERRLTNFVAEHLTRQEPPAAPEWSDRVLFLDVDGVLDWPVMAFPHTTPAGAAAIRLLAANGISVVLNTARSIESVREYCEVLGLPGGIAEYGSVFWDAVGKREVSLIGHAEHDSIERWRREAASHLKCLAHPGFRYSAQLFRFSSSGPQTLSAEEMETRALGPGLMVRRTQSDTWIGAAAVSKERAATQVLGLLPRRVVRTYAIGDSAPDERLLRQVDAAFAPANASREIRSLARAGQCRIMKSQLQRGLLEAAEMITGRSAEVAPPADLLDRLLSLCDRPWPARLRAGFRLQEGL